MKTFDDKKKAREVKRPKGSASSEGFSWGFCAVVCCTMGLAAFLMFSAWGRFSGVAWGSLVENRNDLSVENEGFVSVDMSDAYEEGKELVPALPEALPSPLSGDLPVRLASLPEPQMPQVPQVPMPESKEGGQSLLLPVVDIAEDFGPLPKDLSDFESIILNTQDDGTRLPEDGVSEDIEDIMELEAPEGDIRLTDVGVGWKEHIVKSGETLSDIALGYAGVTAQDILRSNGLKDANRLSANQLLLIPNTPDDVEATLEEVRTRQFRIASLREEVKPLSVLAYVVVQGDSLWSIANAQNIELDTLVGSNTFKSSATLRPGAVLRIPNQDGIFYTMRKGDRIELVCKRYQVDLDLVRKVNPTIDVVSLKPGNEVFLPGARPEAVAEVRVENKKVKLVPVRDKGRPQKGGRSYRWPVMGRINSPFGWRRHPVTRRRDFHTGIDIKASRGMVIRSARDGRVAYSGWMGGYGKVVVVEHAGGQSTLYAHCSSVMVPQGTKISQGQNIARVGTTGRSTGPHLHFEVRRGNSPVNPLQYLK